MLIVIRQIIYQLKNIDYETNHYNLSSDGINV